ncbi:MAG: TIGR01440 family protein [Phascolarctobacterium sp.]|nr:TIGR01440 family protein [Phascolarctobacterium sp.]
MKEIVKQLVEAAEELIQVAKPRAGQIFVLGCSTSEVQGAKIGSKANPDLAVEMFKALRDVVEAHGLCLAIQCCEHLNRSLVVEASTCDKYNLTEVTVRPTAHAGGSMATAAYENFAQPVVVEQITAHLGLDVGQTLIGMHLKRVAVPVRLQHKTIGDAILTAARTRPPLIGGERAAYPEKIR